MVASQPSLFGYEPIIEPIGEDRFKLQVKLIFVDSNKKTADKVIPITGHFWTEHAASIYARNWVERHAGDFPE